MLTCLHGTHSRPRLSIRIHVFQEANVRRTHALTHRRTRSITVHIPLSHSRASEVMKVDDLTFQLTS